MVFMLRYKVEVIVRKEKEKASVSVICRDLKPPYSIKIAVKSYPMVC